MKKVLVAFLVIVMCINITFSYVYAKDEILVEPQIIEYTESIDEFNNPDCGFYRPTGVRVKPEGDWWKGTIWYSNGLVHLRMGLRAFSEKFNGVQDYDITPDVIEKMNIWIDQLRKNGGTAIIRFAYDDFEGYANLEPDIEQIEKHIEQLKPFFEANEDIIAGVETGFLGPYGEQHTSKIVKDENIKRVTEKLLEVVPESRTVSVRRPRYYCCTTGVDISKIDENISVEGTSEYRIGVFNDGYLGSASDLGTFVNRKKEIVWLNNQATHTLYGGEAVWVESIKDCDENGNLYNSPEHIQEEMFQTHTSYLNIEWNNNLIDKWKATMYAGDDELYQGSTVFTYIKNHLGYRLSLISAKIDSQVAQGSTAKVEFNLKNSGAGNVVNKKKAYLILKNEEKEYSFLTEIDIRKLLSRQEKNYEIDVPISDEMELGSYDIYLKIVDEGSSAEETKRAIRFANVDVWNADVGANKLGTITVTEKKELIGDLDKDGDIDVNDLAILKLHLIGRELENSDKHLADLDGDNAITINDLAKLKLKILTL